MTSMVDDARTIILSHITATDDDKCSGGILMLFEKWGRNGFD